MIDFKLAKLQFVVLIVLCNFPPSTPAEDRTQPTIDAMTGPLFFGDHLYLAESRVHLPIWRAEQFSLTYRQHEVTPVLREGKQTQLLRTRNQFEGDWSLNDYLRMIAVGGYQHTALEDRAGSLGAYEFGFGVGSPIGRERPWLEWSMVAGGYADRQNLNADTWADLHLVWRVHEFAEGQMYETSFRPSIGLAVDIESSNDDGDFNALYRIGPVFDFLSATGNRLRFRAQYHGNDGNPFFETSYSSMFLGVEVSASLDEKVLFNAREHRPTGLLPLVWGQYDAGFGGDRSVQRTELTAEIHDIKLASHVFTPVLWYESRQEYRPGDFDNVSYSISFGAQTWVGLASPLSQGQPLVLGLEYLHRSAHALDPSANRVPPPTVLPHDSVNIFPRVRLQTLGWDLPYRDPSIYQGAARWLHRFDWRLTLGYDFHHSRDRDNPAAQAGLNWDVASLGGCVMYARGLVSIGNETPDWQGELGVRRRRGKLFFRYESYGLESDLARGNTAVAGLGFHL